MNGLAILSDGAIRVMCGRNDPGVTRVAKITEAYNAERAKLPARPAADAIEMPAATFLRVFHAVMAEGRRP